MEFGELSQRARAVRELFEASEIEKFGRPWSREELALGLVGDIGELAKLVQAAEGVREVMGAREKLEHELSDVMWSIIVLADEFQVDLEAAFLRTMEEIERSLAA